MEVIGSRVDPPWKVAIMGDSTWLWKTSKRVTSEETGTSKPDHTRAFMLMKIKDTGGCDFDMDIDTTKGVAKAGQRVHDWYPEVATLVSKEGWSADGRSIYLGR